MRWLQSFRWPVKLAMLVIALLAVIAIGSGCWLPWDPAAIDLQQRLLPPGAAHWLGTDHLGRDIFSRLLAATRVSLGAVMACLLLVLLIGLAVGGSAGLLGGRAAEQLVLGDISTGASNDISRATQLARKMVGTYGMSEQLGNVAFDAGHDEVFIGKSMAQTRPYSEKTAAEMDGEIRRIMDDAYARCTAILEQYRPQLVEVAEYLLANETMTAEEFEKVFRTE